MSYVNLIHNAYVGSWHAVPMYSHDGNRDIVVSKCPTSVLQQEIRQCSPTDTLLFSCVDSYFPLCPSFLGSLTTLGNSSGCLMYSIGVAGVYLVEDYLASTYNCEVHAFDYTYHENNEKHVHSNVYYHFIGLHSKNSSIDYSRKTVYGAVSGELMSFGELHSYLQHFRSTSKFSSQRARNDESLAMKKVNVLKLDCEGNL